MPLTEIKEIADSLYKAGNMECTLWYNQALSIPQSGFDRKDWETLASIYSNYAGYWLEDRDNAVMAFPLLQKAIEIDRAKCRPEFALTGAYVSLSRIYYNYGNRDKAMSTLRDALRQNLRSDRPYRSNYVIANLIIMALEAERADSLAEDIKLWQRKGNLSAPMGRYCQEMAKAITEYNARDFDNAVSHALKALSSLDSETGNDTYRCYTYIAIAEALSKASQNEKALSYLEKAASIPIADNLRLFTCTWAGRLKESILANKGMGADAAQSKIQTLMMRDSLINSRSYTVIRDLEKVEETEMLHTDLEKSERERTLLEDRHRLQSMILIIVSLAAAIIIALLAWALAKSRKLNQCNRALFQKNVEAIEISNPVGKTVSAHNPPDDDDISASAFESIKQFMMTRQEIYKPDFTIEEMASHIGMSVKQISKAINGLSGNNFNNFLAEYRIKEAERIILSNTGANRPKLEAVAEMVGYRSRSHFSKVFKDVTGMTPSEFSRQSLA